MDGFPSFQCEIFLRFLRDSPLSQPGPGVASPALGASIGVTSSRH
jgi:hypothetical protein